MHATVTMCEWIYLQLLLQLFLAASHPLQSCFSSNLPRGDTEGSVVWREGGEEREGGKGGERERERGGGGNIYYMHIKVTCVVFPLPVSPMITTVR